MSTNATAVRPEILEGRLDKLRVAVPTGLGRIHLRIDDTPVAGTLEDETQRRVLRDLAYRRAPVRAGVLTDAGGAHEFSWLICPGGPGVPPVGYARQGRLYALTVAGSAAVAAVGLVLAWMLGTGSMWRVFALIGALVAVLVGAVVGGVAGQAWWRNWTRRAAILQSESRYRDDDGRPAKAMALAQPEAAAPSDVPKPKTRRKGKPATAPSPIPQADYRLADDGEPPIAHVRGVLTALTHESVRAFNSGPSWGLYRFVIGTEPYLMRVGENLGKPEPFLAEGDRVELAVHGGESPRTDKHRIVYGLRNLEDGRVYLCHRTFRGGRAKDGPIGVGPRQRGPVIRGAAGWLLAVWVMIVGLVAFSVPDAHLAGLAQVGLIAFVCLLAVWGLIVLPMVHADRRWRQGRPTQRQQTLTRIYRILDLGTPLAPTAPIEEL